MRLRSRRCKSHGWLGWRELVFDSLNSGYLAACRRALGYRGSQRRSSGRRCLRLLRFTTAEQPLQQARPAVLRWGLQLAQGLALQATQLAEQQGHLARLTDPRIQVLGEILEWPTHIPWQWQCLQLRDQRSQGGTGLVDSGFPTLFGVEHGFFQAWNQRSQAGVHVIGTHDFAHFLHALVNGAVRTFRCQGAAHQPATQQVEPRVPATFELFLLFDAFEVFLFPALCFVAHSWVPRGAGLNAGNASAVSEPGKRISTATGR
ncbi:hypothetical protein D9M71_317360 [compost metagenome]